MRLSGFPDLFQGGYFEHGACYEVVESLQVQFKVTQTILPGNDKGVYKNPLFYLT